jgi:ribosomal protein S8
MINTLAFKLMTKGLVYLKQIKSIYLKLIASILESEGFIRGFELIEDGHIKTMKLHLKYSENNERVINISVLEMHYVHVIINKFLFSYVPK